MKKPCRSSDFYIYRVGEVPVLALGASVFFAYNQISSQAVNEEQAGDLVGYRIQQQQTIKPLKMCGILYI